jgi:hypothetical protein
MSTGGLGVGMGSIGLREVRGVEAPDASKPDFTVMTVPQVSPSDIGGGGVERGTGGRGEYRGTQGNGTSSGSSASIGSFVFALSWTL